jgi:phospholipid/cholesterol/gamma-HCH transport system permease protein
MFGGAFPLHHTRPSNEQSTKDSTGRVRARKGRTIRTPAALALCRCLLDAMSSGRYASTEPAAHGSRFAQMAETSETPSLLSVADNSIRRLIFGVQDYSLLAMQSVTNVFTPPFYSVDALEQMDLIGIGSLPIVLIVGFFTGAVLVLQTSSQFERFGATALTSDAVALALVRELGPTITAVVFAGRNASGIASQLGSMVVTEQVDAMRALGTDPIRKLMTPRVLATVLSLPLLTAMADFVGLVGGFLVASLSLRLGAVEFWTRAINALDMGDIVQGVVKSFVFGFIIATVACYQGLRVKGGTQGVGRATTQAVVISSVLVIVVDAFLSKLLLWAFSK